MTRLRDSGGRLLPGPRADTVMLTARIPTSIVESLTAAAERCGITRTEAVREALAVWLEERST